MMTAFLKIFRRFPTTFRRFPKIRENLSERHLIVAEHFRKFPKMPEDFPGLPKTFDEDPKVFWQYTDESKNNLRDKLYSSENIDIVTSEDMENTPLDSRM